MSRYLGSGREKCGSFWNRRLAANWKKYLSPTLMVLGAVVLGYVGSQYYEMHREQQRLQAMWQSQQKASASGGAKSESSQPADDGLIRLEIPKIELSAIV